MTIQRHVKRMITPRVCIPSAEGLPIQSTFNNVRSIKQDNDLRHRVTLKLQPSFASLDMYNFTVTLDRSTSKASYRVV